MRTAFPSAMTILACLALATGCSNPGTGNPTAEPSAAATTAPSPTETPAPSEKPSPAATKSSAPTPTPSPSPTVEAAAPLSETFTSPDGALTFRYPAGWTVVETANQQSSENTAYRSWSVTSPDGQTTLDLGVTAGIAPIGSAPLTVILPQGGVPGAADHVARGARAVVAASPGQALGGAGYLFFGMATDVGGDTTMFGLPWGEGHILSFGGRRELGPSDQVDLGAEAQKFVADPQFRNEILPIIQSLTVSAPPPWGRTSSGGGQAAGDCVGARYTYQNLQGVTCDEAKAILQTVLDTGAPLGARSQVTPEYECYESSYVEQTDGLPLMTCWALDANGQRGQVVLEANAW